MPANHVHLIAACLAMVLLVLCVALAMGASRFGEARRKRIHPQEVATSSKMAARMEHTEAADNFRNLFEVPVLFYTLMAIALATGYVPPWLVVCSWSYVVLRYVHSLIHCTYNKVYHRTTAFTTSFLLLVGMWIAFFIAVASKSGL